MEKRTFTEKGFTFKRIDKKTAKTAYINGLTVVISPVNMYPFSEYGFSYNINRKSRENFCIDEIGISKDFESLVNSYEYYNCNSETGKYTAFYIPVKEVDRFTGEEPTTATLGTVEEYDYNFLNY